MLREIGEQIEFARRQRQFLSAARDAPGLHVEREIADLAAQRRFLIRPAQQRPEPREQLGKANGLTR